MPDELLKLATEYPATLAQFSPQYWKVTNTIPTASPDIKNPDECFLLGDVWVNFIVDLGGVVTGHASYVCVSDLPGSLKWDNIDGTPFNY